MPRGVGQGDGEALLRRPRRRIGQRLGAQQQQRRVGRRRGRAQGDLRPGGDADADGGARRQQPLGGGQHATQKPGPAQRGEGVLPAEGQHRRDVARAGIRQPGGQPRQRIRARQRGGGVVGVEAERPLLRPGQQDARGFRRLARQDRARGEQRRVARRHRRGLGLRARASEQPGMRHEDAAEAARDGGQLQVPQRGAGRQRRVEGEAGIEHLPPQQQRRLADLSGQVLQRRMLARRRAAAALPDHVRIAIRPAGGRRGGQRVEGPAQRVGAEAVAFVQHGEGPHAGPGGAGEAEPGVAGGRHALRRPAQQRKPGRMRAGERRCGVLALPIRRPVQHRDDAEPRGRHLPQHRSHRLDEQRGLAGERHHHRHLDRVLVVRHLASSAAPRHCRARGAARKGGAA
jgi:hypothetical protein